MYSVMGGVWEAWWCGGVVLLRVVWHWPDMWRAMLLLILRHSILCITLPDPHALYSSISHYGRIGQHDDKLILVSSNIIQI